MIFLQQVRINQEQEHFLINPFGLTYGEITASSLVKVDMQGDVIEKGTTTLGINKAGFTLHSAIHQARPDLKCVIHLHTSAAVAVSLESIRLSIVQLTTAISIIQLTTVPLSYKKLIVKYKFIKFNLILVCCKCRWWIPSNRKSIINHWYTSAVEKDLYSDAWFHFRCLPWNVVSCPCHRKLLFVVKSATTNIMAY